MFFKRFFIALFAFFGSFFLFIFIVRISQGKTGFLGLSDLFSYLETCDFQAPIDRLVSDVTSTYNTFNSFILKLWTVGKWAPTLILPVMFLVELVQIVSVLVIIMWDIFILFIQYIQMFGGFISFITTFEGSPAIVYT